MSYFAKWKAARESKSMMAYDARAPGERKTESRKQEEVPKDQHMPLGQGIQKAEGAQSTEDKTKETAEGQAAEEGPPLSKAEPRKDSKDWKPPIPLGPVYPPLISSSMNTTKAGGRSWELSPRVAKSFRIHDAPMSCLPQQGPFQQYMDMRVERRLASRKERRSRFGDIDVHKCYQSGQIFSPFQALATTEMRRLVFPRDLPVSSHMRRIGASCATDVKLQDLPLSFTELGFRKDYNNHEKEKPASQIKASLFPPIVRGTKSNDMK